MTRAPLPYAKAKDRAPAFREMKAFEYNAAMTTLGLTDHFAQAQFLRCVIRTTWGYSNGATIPRPVAMLLRLMKGSPRTLTPDFVKEKTE